MKPLFEPPKYQRETTAIWRPEVPSEDTAPARGERVDTDAWVVRVGEAAAALARQVCPICGEGPWQSPLNHVSRKHGVDRFTMRDLCGLTTCEKVAAPDLSERFAERGRNADLTAMNEAARKRKKQRWTRAGLAKNTAIIVQQNSTRGA